MKYLVFVFKSALVLFLFFACSADNQTLTCKVETAHQKHSFLNKKAIQFNLLLRFGDKERLNAKMTLSTDSRNGLVEMQNGNKIFFFDDKVFYSPNMAADESIRFDAYTWSYFTLFPYKMSDEGTIWEESRQQKVNGSTFETQKLTFDSGVGDAPDDWYLMYTDSQTYMVRYLAYIVTYKKDLQKANEDPHAIEYLNYAKVDGIPIATEWKFWSWDKKVGFKGQIGEAKLSNIKFLSSDDSLFKVPLGYQSM